MPGTRSHARLIQPSTEVVESNASATSPKRNRRTRLHAQRPTAVVLNVCVGAKTTRKNVSSRQAPVSPMSRSSKRESVYRANMVKFKKKKHHMGELGRPAMLKHLETVDALKKSSAKQGRTQTTGLGAHCKMASRLKTSYPCQTVTIAPRESAFEVPHGLASNVGRHSSESSAKDSQLFQMNRQFSPWSRQQVFKTVYYLACLCFYVRATLNTVFFV
jgi:hypothetical protein